MKHHKTQPASDIQYTTYDDLLAALELADATLKRFEYGEKPYQTDDEGEQIYAQIAAAITKATTETKGGTI